MSARYVLPSQVKGKEPVADSDGRIPPGIASLRYPSQNLFPCLSASSAHCSLLLGWQASVFVCLSQLKLDEEKKAHRGLVSCHQASKPSLLALRSGLEPIPQLRHGSLGLWGQSAGFPLAKGALVRKKGLFGVKMG